MKSSRLCFQWGLLIFVLLAFLSAAHAEEAGSDRYASEASAARSDTAAKKIAVNFLALPLEIPRWLLDKTLFYTEKYRLDRKILWLYEKVQDFGLAPYGSLVSFGDFGGGLNANFIRMLKQQGNVPNLTAKSWIEWNRRVNFKAGAQTGLERIGGSGFHIFETAQYENRPEEHFYGIGKHTSAGDGTSYRMESTTLESRLGYSASPVLSFDGLFTYRNVNITNGEDGGRGVIDTTFPENSIPGLAGDRLIMIGTELKHDTRDRGDNATRGGREKISFGYNRGLGGSDARYLKYQAELSRYIRLGSDRRILALRLYAEENGELNHGNVPFYDMAKLGGSGTDQRLSQMLRGFDFNRFFDKSATVLNLEYRYAVWEHRDLKLDAVLFFDEGQVARKLTKMRFDHFRESYGAGWRLSLANNTMFSAEMAHGDEGTNIYVKSSAPF